MEPLFIVYIFSGILDPLSVLQTGTNFLTDPLRSYKQIIHLSFTNTLLADVIYFSTLDWIHFHSVFITSYFGIPSTNHSTVLGLEQHSGRPFVFHVKTFLSIIKKWWT
jgi:hypothetical protein